VQREESIPLLSHSKREASKRTLIIMMRKRIASKRGKPTLVPHRIFLTQNTDFT